MYVFLGIGFIFSVYICVNRAFQKSNIMPPLEIETSMPEILKKYAKDSIDLSLMLGDTFSILGDHICPIRNGICIMELNHINKSKNVIQDIRTYVGVVDVKNKKLKGIFYFEEGFQHVLLDYYRDTLYLAESWGCFSIRYCDIHTGKTDIVNIDPCGTATDAGSIVRTGCNLFVTGTPYRAGIVDWRTKFCIEPPILRSRSSGSGFVHPINKDINLINYTEDTSGHRHFYAYDNKGKKKWQFIGTQYTYFYGYKNYFVGVNAEKLILLDKQKGNILKSFLLGKDKTLDEWSIVYVEDNIVYLRSNMRNNDKFIPSGLGNTELMAIDIMKEKLLWKKEIKGNFLTKYLDNLFITSYKANDKSNLRYMVYSRDNFELLDEYEFKTKKIEFSKKDSKWKGWGGNIWLDRETDVYYTRSQNMLYW